MNHENLLAGLNELKSLIDQSKISGADVKELKDKAQIKYGELEEAILRITGINIVEVRIHGGHKVEFKNYIEAMLFSGMIYHDYVGYSQLLQVIGRVQMRIKDPVIPIVEPSITSLVTTLRRFRECCQYINELPRSEIAVQDIIWIMLRSQFDRVDREDTLPKFGIKSYRPDFGIPDLGVLVEAKYIGDKTTVAAIQDEIFADIPPYLSSSPKYSGIVVLVYDQAQKLRDPIKFIEDIKSIDGILDVLVIPGIG